MKFVEPTGLNRKFGAMGHPSRGADRCRVLGFYLEIGTAGCLTIQIGPRLSAGREYKFITRRCAAVNDSTVSVAA
jgi:hypothetical protein